MFGRMDDTRLGAALPSEMDWSACGGLRAGATTQPPTMASVYMPHNEEPICLHTFFFTVV